MNQQSFARVAGICAVVFLLVPAIHASPVSIALVPVGDPGNTADTNDGDFVAVGIQHYGSVPYSYDIGKYDVTLTQYTAFLNAVASSDPNNLYTSNMATDLNSAGISRSGSSGHYTYSVIGSGQRPVTYVSWFDAARFCNWLTNGQGGAGTETGMYTLTGSTSMSGTLPADHSALVGTKWFVPTEDEWYKAAYYKGGGTNVGYWAYPFQSDTKPTSNQVSGGSNSGNFKSPTTGYAVTQSTTYSSSQNYLTDVGVYTSAFSPYGSYDMGGDVFQWNETSIDSSRGTRGGVWSSDASTSADSNRNNAGPTFESSHIGFRVAELPEPSTITLSILGAIGVWFAGRRRRVKAV